MGDDICRFLSWLLHFLTFLLIFQLSILKDFLFKLLYGKDEQDTDSEKQLEEHLRSLRWVRDYDYIEIQVEKLTNTRKKCVKV